MKNNKTLARILAILLCLAAAACVLASCKGNENETESESATKNESSASVTEPFDYMNVNLSKYMSLDKSVYQNMSVTVSDIYKVTDANVQNYIAGLLKEYPQPVKITDRPVVEGDTVYIYYEGLLDGVAFKGGTYDESRGEPYGFKIGSGKFIDGFEEGLIGIIPEDTSKEDPAVLNLSFPESYPINPDLAGKAVVFNVYIKYISNETCVPEYTKETVTDILGFTSEGDDVMADFEAYIKTLLEEEHKQAVLSEVSKILLENVTIKSYPQHSVDYWYGQYLQSIQEYADYFTGFGFTFEQVAAQMLGVKEGEDWQAALTDYAQNTVKSEMVYYYLIKQNGLTVSNKEYNDKVKYFVDYYSSDYKTYTEQEIIDAIGGKDAIHKAVLFEKVDNMLFINTTVTYKKSESK